MDMSITNLYMMLRDRIEADYGDDTSKEGKERQGGKGGEKVIRDKKVDIREYAKKHGSRQKNTVHRRD